MFENQQFPGILTVHFQQHIYFMTSRRKILHQAIENEVEEFMNQFKDIQDENGRKIVKRNGYLPEKEVQTGIGSIEVKKPRVREEKFTSAILPSYMRRALSIDTKKNSYTFLNLIIFIH